MAQRPVNDAQLVVLQWLADGGSQDPPRDEMKQSATALATRGLAAVHRRGGKWTAELTDDGRYYLEHRKYPPRQYAERKRAERSHKKSVGADRNTTQANARGNAKSSVPPPPPEPARAPEPDVPLRQVVLRPHPAVKELRDHPQRLPEGFRHRCVLIANSIVTEALARGWTVTPVKSELKETYWGSKHREYPNKAMLLLDAGHSKVGIVFSEVTKRYPHQDTEEEAAKRAKGQYVRAPAYDYVGDGRLRLQLTDAGGNKSGQSWADSTNKHVEDRVPAVLEAVERASQRALEWAEEKRRREEEVERKRLEAYRIDGLRREYEVWEAALVNSAAAWEEHRRQAAFVDALERDMPDDAEAFIAWARGHLTATDPRRGLPTGAAPEWTHEKRAASGRYSSRLTPRW